MTGSCWSDNQLTGIERFDSHYKMLCDILNYLVIASHVDSESEGQAILTALYDYISYYCADEEQLMIENKFTEYATHKLAHDEFLKTIDQQLKRVSSGEASVDGITHYIKTWLNLHIICEDSKHVEYVKRSKSRAFAN